MLRVNLFLQFYEHGTNIFKQQRVILQTSIYNRCKYSQTLKVIFTFLTSSVKKIKAQN
jgi:hypothetical protein